MNAPLVGYLLPMEAFLVILFGVAVVAVVGVFLLRMVRAEQKRMRSFAESHGMSYRPDDGDLAKVKWGKPFGFDGSSRLASHVMTGTAHGRPFTVFEYSHGKRSTYTIVAVQLTQDYPLLVVEPEGASAQVLGESSTDIDVEYEAFNRRFVVTCEDRRFASDALEPRFVEWLVASGSPGFRIADKYLVTVRDGPIHPQQLTGQIDYTNGVVDRLPSIILNR